MHLLTQLSKYFFVILMLLFALESYMYFNKKKEEQRARLLARQRAIIFCFLLLAFLLLYLNSFDIKVIILFGASWVSFFVTSLMYRKLYPAASQLMVNEMMMLLSIGLVMIARIDVMEAVKQWVIVAGAFLLSFLVPVLVKKMKFLDRLTWLYAIVGLVALGGVLLLAVSSGGAKLSLTVAGISIQFSEIVKITLVFFMAAQLAKDRSFRSVLLTTVVAALHVVLLVLSTDLGTASVFFVAYVVMVYVATHKARYPLAALGGGTLAAVAAYKLFSHVQRRVTAWRDPFAVYETSGYQIVQGLFAIGAGGWFGTGLCAGRPETIPVATRDFIFAAICEEFGAVFGICLLLICMSLFLLIVNISMQIHGRFYRLVALGLGVEYAFQVFLTVGGVTKFIPMTGITLPLVAYGGSSVVSTIIMLSIIQGLYILRKEESGHEEAKRDDDIRAGK